MHRLRGDLLNVRGDPTGAERDYHFAHTVTGRQSAKLFELRAAMKCFDMCGSAQLIVARSRGIYAMRKSLERDEQ
jgi:hypothetical protein